MAAPRVTLSDDDRQIKMADRALIAASGKIEGVAALLGYSTSTVGEWQALDNARFMPAPVRQKLEDATRGVEGHPHATRYAARRQGFAVVKLPGGELPTDASAHAALAESLRKAGALHQALCGALADGIVDAAEAETIERLAIDAAEQNMRVATLAAQIRETR